MLRKLTGIVVNFIVASALCACSIVEPHPDLTNTLRTARLTGGVSIDNPSRWTLPPFAAITVEHADGRIDHERLFAAQTGLAPYFSIASGDAPWQINVHWPDSAYPAVDPVSVSTEVTDEQGHRVIQLAQSGGEALKKAGSYLVRTADRDVLIVDVVQTSTRTLVTRLEVEVEPWLRGRDWHDPVALTRTFMAVGEALSGT